MGGTEIPRVSIEIAARFFDAVEALRANKKIRGLGTLATLWGVSRFAMTWAKNHPYEKRIKIEYLYYIARDYKVSLDWLFFGKGKMFK